MNFFDLHCDTAALCVYKKIGLRGDTMVSLDKRGGIDRWAEVFALWLPGDITDAEAYEAYRQYLAGAKKIVNAEPDAITFCRTNAEIDAALDAGKCAAILSVENGAALGGQLASVAEFANDGVKLITITWNGQNALGYGSDVGGHLKPFGREAVAEMLRLGIMPDISHLSDEGVEDIFTLTDQPIVATHSNIKRVHDHVRNLNDTFFKELVRRNGLVGMNLYTEFLRGGDEADWDDLFRHIDGMLDMGGQDILAFGSDFDGANMPHFCRDLADIPTVYERCTARYGRAQTDKIFYDNARAFFNRVF